MTAAHAASARTGDATLIVGAGVGRCARVENSVADIRDCLILQCWWCYSKL